MFDLHPATQRTLRLATGIPDDDLQRPTPCPGTTVGDLIDHLGMFGRNFLAAARKQTSVDDGRPPAPSASNLAADWRAQLQLDLEAMATAWSEPAAWTGSTVAGSIELPAEVVGLVALDELVVHGWDLAVATSQPFRPTEAEIAAATSFVASFDAPRDGTLFGPVVDVPADAGALDRLVGLTGRDPGWRPLA
jgi:uncharacterized protein (TIGR03086 family)